ncbi:TVP38/TMEM64 family protein [Priestia koreensis]|uniref:TVP38/TMEM64 family protein n=1 Tax=Priestia koreensis TaxID=284581 RepID=UPI003457C096
MKKFIPILALISLWSIAWITADRYHITIHDVQHWIRHQNDYAYLLFVLAFSFRILLFIPSSLFIIMGGMLFSPVETIIMTIISMGITESIIYLLGNHYARTEIFVRLKRKYPTLFEKLKGKHWPLFFIMSSPGAPTDAACFLAASLQMRYPWYILMVGLASIPMATLYYYFGRLLLKFPLVTFSASALVFLLVVFFLWIRRRVAQQRTLLHHSK